MAVPPHFQSQFKVLVDKRKSRRTTPEILCTLGPASLDRRTIQRLEQSGATLLRINLSHTKLVDLPRKSLSQLYQDEFDKLGQSLELDLSCWRNKDLESWQHRLVVENWK